MTGASIDVIKTYLNFEYHISHDEDRPHEWLLDKIKEDNPSDTSTFTCLTALKKRIA